MAVAQRLADDHLGQGIHEPVMLRQRDEAGRRDEAVLRMLPAGERLHADPMTVLEAHLGLIPGPQLILLQGPAQIVQGEVVAVLLLAAHLLGPPEIDQLRDLLLAGGLVDTPEHLQAVGAAHPQHGIDHVVFQGAAQHYAAAKAAEGEPAQQGHAIHAGHAQIAKQDVDLMVLALGQRRFTVLGLQQVAVAKPAELMHQGLALEVVILHHHDHPFVPCTIHRAITPFHL
ncbi:hypothetical protein D3C79_818460 [compost metagenome]